MRTKASSDAFRARSAMSGVHPMHGILAAGPADCMSCIWPADDRSGKRCLVHVVHAVPRIVHPVHIGAGAPDGFRGGRA
jgi:hypothetical protein